jgi:hypothetical protein
MTRALATRRAVGIVSTALVLGIAAPAASARGLDRPSTGPAATAATSSYLPATNRVGLGDLGYSPTSRATPDICDPFSPALEICAAGGGYGVSNASNTPSARPSRTAAVNHSRGFDWGDAAIGAAATMVLVGIGLGGVRAATNNRSRHAAAS